MSAEAGPPLLEVDDRGVATLTLRRPAHLNRLHAEDLDALREHLQALASSPQVRALVLTGQGRVFCAGYHIGELEAGDSAAVDGPQRFEATVDLLEALPVPTIARLNGSVYGGATDLALACDFRIGTAAMELRMPAARLGLHYYPAGLRRYVSRLGLQAAKHLFLLAQAWPADALVRIGYLDEAVDAEALDERVAARVMQLLANAPLAVNGMKLSLDEIARGEYDLPRLREREARCATSLDLREGLAAFAQRREPRFQGR